MHRSISSKIARVAHSEHVVDLEESFHHCATESNISSRFVGIPSPPIFLDQLMINGVSEHGSEAARTRLILLTYTSSANLGSLALTLRLSSQYSAIGCLEANLRILSSLGVKSRCFSALETCKSSRRSMSDLMEATAVDTFSVKKNE